MRASSEARFTFYLKNHPRRLHMAIPATKHTDNPMKMTIKTVLSGGITV